jgi:hypothetical protein
MVEGTTWEEQGGDRAQLVIESQNSGARKVWRPPTGITLDVVKREALERMSPSLQVWKQLEFNRTWEFLPCRTAQGIHDAAGPCDSLRGDKTFLQTAVLSEDQSEASPGQKNHEILPEK